MFDFSLKQKFFLWTGAILIIFALGLGANEEKSREPVYKIVRYVQLYGTTIGCSDFTLQANAADPHDKSLYTAISDPAMVLYPFAKYNRHTAIGIAVITIALIFSFRVRQK